MTEGTDLDVSISSPHHDNRACFPYSPSTESIASSSWSSVDSIEAPSSQSSLSPQSVHSSTTEWSNDSEDQYYNGRQSRRGSSDSSNGELAVTYTSHGEVVVTSYTSNAGVLSTSNRNVCPAPCKQPSTEVLAPEVRKHPRRTQQLNPLDTQAGTTTAACSRIPPPLVRQSERKDNFVDSLVDTSTQMIEAIWPLSVMSCSREATLSGTQQNLIGLRTFVQEVLKRSKTSYSTLQVALYYLILIQSCIPKHDFTMEQSEDSPSCRAMQCGRRMFLAALILASKYLQDRNYSARAWSKISGLRTCEINQNERAFLNAVNWKLHMPEPVFQRWVAIVLKYSPSAQVNTPRSCPSPVHTWKSIVPLLTPELDSFDFGSADLANDSGYNSPGSDMSPPPLPVREMLPPCSARKAATPTDICTISRTPTPTKPILRALQPSPCMGSPNKQSMPILPRLAPLPTPEMTPQTGTICTPAVSAYGFCPGKSSMGYAMAQVDDNCLARSTLDKFSGWKSCAPTPTPPSIRALAFSTPARRSLSAKTTSSTSSRSSPESMLSDNSSRSSRSSSISSVASSNCALRPLGLAAQASRRCAKMQLVALDKGDQRPVAPLDGRYTELAPMEYRSKLARHDGLQQLQTHKELPSRFKDSLSQYNTLPGCHDPSTREAAAAALQHLAIDRECPHSTALAVKARPQKGAKRPRPESIYNLPAIATLEQEYGDYILATELEAAVQESIAPRCLDGITNVNSRMNEEDGKVLPDPRLADSFLEPRSGHKKPSLNTVDVDLDFLCQAKGKPASSRDGLPRKKARAGSDRRGREKALMVNRSIKEKRLNGRCGPGMWDGILN